MFIRPYSDSWSTDLQHLIAEKTEWIQLAVIEHLFTPVIIVAGVVCGIGIILFAISLIVRSQPPTRTVTQPVQPAPQPVPPQDTKRVEAAAVEPEPSVPKTIEDDKT